MKGNRLDDPWVFAGAVVVLGAVVWGGLEFVFFGDEVGEAVLKGAASGLAFALFYVVFRRRFEE